MFLKQTYLLIKFNHILCPMFMLIVMIQILLEDYHNKNTKKAQESKEGKSIEQANPTKLCLLFKRLMLFNTNSM